MEAKRNLTPSQGNYDPGWNDPPTFSYTGQTSSNKPKNLLNKRVAFPLNANSANSSPQNINLPPSIPAPNLPIVPLQLPPEIKSFKEESVDVNIPSLDDVKNILDEIINDNSELGNKLEDIKKKIGVMETMWIEGKLNNDIKIRMLKLSEALKSGKINEADEIHKSLMVDHVTLVSGWMIGIKKIIFHCLAKNELLKIDQES